VIPESPRALRRSIRQHDNDRDLEREHKVNRRAGRSDEVGRGSGRMADIRKLATSADCGMLVG
jgi:hypothetical protein